MRHLKYVVVILALTVNVGTHGQSPDVPASRMNALSCDPLPTPLRIEVQILDNSERIVAFKELFENELRARGTEVSRAAAAIATLDIRTVREFQGAPRDPVFERRPDQENSGIGQGGTFSLQGNVWSTKDSSLFGGPKGESDKFSLNQLQVSASVNDRTDGRCLWQGEVLHDLHGDEDPDALTAKIIPVLARALGKTIRNRRLNLYP